MPIKTSSNQQEIQRSDAQAYLDIADPNFRFGVTYDVEKSPFLELASGPTRYLLPTFATPQEERKYRKEHLALTFRIMARYGMSEGINGHCSTRDPVDPTTFWVNPFGKSFRQMRASDLVRVSVATGQLVEGIRCADASATGIHAPIYRALPRGSPGAVEAITHVHGPHSKAFSALGRLPDMINQDICAYDGDMAMVPFGGVVIDDAEGTRIASYLGSDKKVAILQSHGVLCVGRLSIDEACWWQVNFEQCIQAQLLADSARRPGEDFLLIDEANRSFTKAELGTPEMGWLSCASMMEDEEMWSGGAHML